ncbi:MAG: adenylate/guanylate cyclase domain-containing protein [Planctomycetia bacterium]|nr:adenylate/guanylate cyclase domain-containing protein [Planctomycetia bacterium]
MRFRTRLALAMLAVVLVATAVGLALNARQVRAAYRATLQDLFESGARSVIAVRDAELAAVRVRCARLASLPRVVGAFESGDRGALEGVADDELREFRMRDSSVGGRASSGYLFLDEKDAPIEPGTGTPALDAAVAARWKREGDAVRRGEAQRLAYLDFQGTATEVLFTPVTDANDGSRLGTLAVLFPYRVAEVASVAGGGELRNGLLIGGTMFGGQLPAEAASRSGDEGFIVRGQPWIAFRQPIDPLDASVQLVIAASLEPMQAALRRLVWSAVAAGGVGVGLGVVAAFAVARSLARPVAAMSEAAQRVGSGDYAVRVPVTRRDELGQLAERFNDMTHGLALRDKYRGLLDLVADPGIAEEMIGGASQLGGVTTPVAVIFCDIRGFTPLSNRLTAPQVVELLNEHMTALTEVVYRHGGVVDKFVGDLIMAVFGAPKPGTDDAARAARCAFEMVRERDRINRTAKEPIQIGVGVAFGDAVAGCMGSRQRLNYTVLGDRVNLGARLCSMAPAMAVYVDDRTRERLGPEWRVTALEPLKVKGFAEPVQAYRLDSVEERS